MEKITYDKLTSKLNNSDKTIILIGAEWCGQTKMTIKTISKIRENLELEDILFIELDADADDLWNNDTLKISKVPSIIMYQENEQKVNVSGYQNEETLNNLIKDFKNI